MLARLIDWSLRNVFLVLLATAFAVAAGVYCGAEDAGRCDPGPVRRAGHRLHRVPGPGAAGGRGPGHLPADDRDARRAALEGRARLLVLRRLVRLHHLRGRHRHLLGALARARVPELRPRPAAAPASRPRSVPTRPASAGSTSTRCSAPTASLAELRTLQDWFIRYQLWKAQGVSEVASIGGFVQQYVVTVDPRKLQAYGVPLSKVIETIRMSNRDVGGRIVELARRPSTWCAASATCAASPISNG